MAVITRKLTDEQRNVARMQVAESQDAIKARKQGEIARFDKLQKKRVMLANGTIGPKRAKSVKKAKRETIRVIARARPAPKVKPAVEPRWIEYRPGLAGAEFYRTRQWAEVRHQVLVRYGARCQCCGADRRTSVIHVDHIKPRSKYPALELLEDNLQVLCELCNIGKSNISEHDWR